MGALLKSLERHFTPTWWLGGAEHIELAPRQIRCVGIAGWKRERFASNPRCVYREWSTVPSRSLPDLVCDQVAPRTSADAQQNNQSICQRAGVPWYWVVDLRDHVVRVLRLVAEEYRLELVADGTSCVTLPPFESVEIDLKATFPPQRWGGARSLERGAR
jgi:Uma2 family endonuclease